MSFETNIPGYLLKGNDKLVFGTAMIAGTYGEITRINVNRTADLIEEEDGNGNPFAVILTKARTELSLEAVIPSTVTVPGLGDQVDFPGVQYVAGELQPGVTGNITGDVNVMWEKKGSRKISFKAAHWDALGAGTFAAVNPAAPTP